MYELANLPKSELDALFQEVSNTKGLSKAIIEKDLWVCVVLDYLFTKSPWRDNLAFKGGTSLSKAYNLIERFSEDIDLILDWRVLGYGKNEPLEDRSANQQSKLNKEILAKTQFFLENVFIKKLREDLSGVLKQRIQIFMEGDAVIIDYDHGYRDSSILQTIRLEIGALAAWTPTQQIVIQPYITEIYPKQFNKAFTSVRTTTPERTFWEKATILHREAYRTQDKSMPDRMSRHYYDVYRMSNLGVLDRALRDPDLLNQVAAFKAKFYPQPWARYDLARIGTLQLIPPEHSLDRLRQDYATMSDMIYGEKPDFDTLITLVAKIEHRINQTRKE